MLIIPALDLKNGRVVRLYQGKQDKEKVYSKSPADTARRFAQEGASLIHVVDLDGAVHGTPKNVAALGKIVNEVKGKGVKIEFGGGVRSEEIVKELLRGGVYRVVLGTLAFEDRALLEKLIAAYKDNIIVSVDIKNSGAIALKGWLEEGARETSFVSFAKYLSDIGIRKIIYTDIVRDGTLSGPRVSLLDNYLGMLSKHKISVIVAGGVSSLDDIKSLKALEKKGVEGVIVGKALYEEKFTLSQALKAA